MSLFQFSVGDKVKIVEAGNKDFGKIFEVTRVRVKDIFFDYTIVNSFKIFHGFYGWQLEKVDE